MKIEDRAYKILIIDLVGLKFDKNGHPDHSQVKSHIETKGGVFHDATWLESDTLEVGKLHFFYRPDLSEASEILAITDQAQYDAVIAAATFIPKESIFNLGGVRIGAGTGNMQSASWGGPSGKGGVAPLMNTPGFNSRATAQMVFKALLRVRPNLPVEALHNRVIVGDFDTGRNLREYPTEKLEGKTFAIIGFGNIGSEVARIAQVFGMRVKIFARPQHRMEIEAHGYEFASTIIEAAQDADIVSVHVGLGPFNSATQSYANVGLINDAVLNALSPNAVVINYDRGEILDVEALARALENGKVDYTAVDADIFYDVAMAAVSGPLAPYIPLARRFPGKLQLLPHAAADTDHPSRVAGAKQAVDQIFHAIQLRLIANLKGDLPVGYSNAGILSGIAKIQPLLKAAKL
jgi:lactate dehydrogenase-like 2-hydroxyacid dehydrogenase